MLTHFIEVVNNIVGGNGNVIYLVVLVGSISFLITLLSFGLTLLPQLQRWRYWWDWMKAHTIGHTATLTVSPNPLELIIPFSRQYENVSIRIRYNYEGSGPKWKDIGIRCHYRWDGDDMSQLYLPGADIRCIVYKGDRARGKKEFNLENITHVWISPIFPDGTGCVKTKLRIKRSH
jgi:hypothetical protein